jgi:hypothetical protein
MSKFKVGDKVRLNNSHETTGTIKYKVSDDIWDILWDDDGEMCKQRENGLELIKERTMKDTITLKELIEQGACKEGIVWFVSAMSDKGRRPHCCCDITESLKVK